MRVKDAKVKLTIPIPIDRPDKNGVVHTKEAVDNALNNLRTYLPIIYRDKECGAQLIGTVTSKSHIVTWDFENQICNVTLDGIIFRSGAEIIVDGIEDGKVTDFKIVGIGLTR